MPATTPSTPETTRPPGEFAASGPPPDLSPRSKNVMVVGGMAGACAAMVCLVAFRWFGWVGLLVALVLVGLGGRVVRRQVENRHDGTHLDARVPDATGRYHRARDKLTGAEHRLRGVTVDQ